MPNILQGTVTKAGAMAKTITVTIERRFEHPKYLKQLVRHTKKLVHDELQEAKLGDRVSITHTRPLSSSKHFYLSAIESRPTDGMRAVPIHGGPPALPPPKTMEQLRKREAAMGKRVVDESVAEVKSSASAEVEQAVRMEGAESKTRPEGVLGLLGSALGGVRANVESR